MAVDHLETGLPRRAGTHQDFQLSGYIAGTEAFHIVGIHLVGQTELLTCSHLRRGAGGNALSKHA